MINLGCDSQSSQGLIPWGLSLPGRALQMQNGFQDMSQNIWFSKNHNF
jgi:hypothetical protein